GVQLEEKLRGDLQGLQDVQGTSGLCFRLVHRFQGGRREDDRLQGKEEIPREDWKEDSVVSLVQGEGEAQGGNQGRLVASSGLMDARHLRRLSRAGRVLSDGEGKEQDAARHEVPDDIRQQGRGRGQKEVGEGTQRRVGCLPQIPGRRLQGFSARWQGMRDLAAHHRIPRDIFHYKCNRAHHPVLRIRDGDTVTFETNGVSSWQINRETTSEDVNHIDESKYYPLAGPVYVEGAKPGDVLVVETLGVKVADFGWSAIIPSFGLLEEFNEPFLYKWDLKDKEYAAFKKGIKIPLRP